MAGALSPMGPPGPREAMERALAATGCRIRPGPAGFGVLVECPSHLARAKVLNIGAEHDARYDPRVRRLAMEIASTVRRDARGKVDEIELARRIHGAVAERVAFLEEGAERFSKAWDTWTLGVGDCDDVARLLLALYRSVGLPAKLVVYDRGDGAPGDILPTHATVVVPAGGRRWWAEASVGGARFGEEPLAAARRVGAQRSELGTEDLRGVGGGVGAAGAFRIIRGVWPADLLAPSPFAVSYAVAWSRVDGAWGGDPRMPNNWGAVHCSSRPDESGACPPGCVPHVDHYADGRPYTTCFKAYPSHEAGARDFLDHLVRKRPMTRAALAAGESVEDVARAMRREHYFGGFCPKAAAQGAGQNDPRCEAEAVESAAKTLRAISAQNAREAGEVDGLALPTGPRGDEPPPAEPSAGPSVVLVVGGAIVLAGLAWYALEG